MADTKKSVFNILNVVDVNGHTEKKNGLTYLSWAWAWAEVKKAYPEANYTIYENENGWNYFTDGRTCWVKTGVTIEGIEHIEYLPVMDFKNKSIPLNAVTSFEVNKAIQRSLTKAIARHGLGLYIYAGEDLPEETDGQNAQAKATPKKQTMASKAKTAPEQTIPVPDKAPAELTREEARSMLVTFCAQNNISLRHVGTEYKLTKDSTADDILDALAYAQVLAEGDNAEQR